MRNSKTKKTLKVSAANTNYLIYIVLVCFFIPYEFIQSVGQIAEILKGVGQIAMTVSSVILIEAIMIKIALETS